MKEIRYLSRKISIVDQDEEGKDVNERVWDEYHGTDVDGSPVDLAKGGTAVVSDEKAAQLERDYPDLFEVVREIEGDEPARTEPAPEPEPTPAPEPEPEPKPPTKAELVKANDRAQLDELARKAGVDEPDKLPNKDAVAAAIVKARKAS